MYRRSTASHPVAIPSGVGVGTDRTPFDFHRRHIAIVDSYEDNRELYAAWFASCGARVSTYATAAEAGEAIGRDAPDAVVVAVHLHREDGVAFGEALAGMPTTAGIPLIALTTSLAEQERASHSRAFAAALMIPCACETLIALTARVLRRSHRRLAA